MEVDFLFAGGKESPGITFKAVLSQRKKAHRFSWGADTNSCRKAHIGAGMLSLRPEITWSREKQQMRLQRIRC